MNSEILFFIIKIVVGGIVSFIAIMLMSKTRDAAWMTLVVGFLLSYAALVYELLIKLGVFTQKNLTAFGIPLISLLFAIIPSLFYIAAFIIKISRK